MVPALLRFRLDRPNDLRDGGSLARLLGLGLRLRGAHRSVEHLVAIANGVDRFPGVFRDPLVRPAFGSRIGSNPLPLAAQGEPVDLSKPALDLRLLGFRQLPAALLFVVVRGEEPLLLALGVELVQSDDGHIAPGDRVTAYAREDHVPAAVAAVARDDQGRPHAETLDGLAQGFEVVPRPKPEVPVVERVRLQLIPSEIPDGLELVRPGLRDLLARLDGAALRLRGVLGFEVVGLRGGGGVHDPPTAGRAAVKPSHRK